MTDRSMDTPGEPSPEPAEDAADDVDIIDVVDSDTEQRYDTVNAGTADDALQL